jgi:hypothetical protein
MKRIGCQRPSSCRPMVGNCSRTRRERLTRSLVSDGRLWVMMMRSRSSTAIALSLTSANGLQLVEWDHLARSRSFEPKLSAFVSTRDTVEHGDDAACVWVGVLDCHREQGAGKGALLDMSALRQPRKSGCVLLVKGDVQAMYGSLHTETLLHGQARIVYRQATPSAARFLTGFPSPTQFALSRVTQPTEVNANHSARLPGGRMSLDDAAK